MVLKQHVCRHQRKSWRVERDLSSHEHEVIKFVYLTVWTNVWWSPEAYTLHMHIFLQVFKFLNCILVELASVIPNSCYKYDLVTRYLHTNSHRRSQAELLDILSIKRFELRQVSYQQGHLDDKWKYIQCLQVLKNHKQLIFLAHFFYLLRCQARIYYRHTELNFLLN